MDAADSYGRGISALAVRQASTRVVADLLTRPGFWEQVARRIIHEVIAEALPLTWIRRAEQLEQVGTPSADEAAVNCRRHAWLLSLGAPDHLDAEVDEALATITAAVAA
jgi:hypothetical protein